MRGVGRASHPVPPSVLLTHGSCRHVVFHGVKDFASGTEVDIWKCLGTPRRLTGEEGCVDIGEDRREKDFSEPWKSCIVNKCQELLEARESKEVKSAWVYEGNTTLQTPCLKSSHLRAENNFV